MSKYTPTTKEVRKAFVYAASGWHRAVSTAKAGFNRWLTEYDRQVAEKAWEEGHATALRYAAYFGEHVPNPYLQGEEQ